MDDEEALCFLGYVLSKRSIQRKSEEKYRKKKIALGKKHLQAYRELWHISYFGTRDGFRRQGILF